MYGVYDATNNAFSIHSDWDEARAAYEAAKQEILNNDPTGGEKVMMFGLQKISTYVGDENKGYNWFEQITHIF